MRWLPILIVDEHDSPIGEASMDEAHAKGLFHRIARVIVEDEAGNLLLQKRAQGMSLYPGAWAQSAAGHVDAGESTDDAAGRELSEEVGLIAELEYLGNYVTQTTYEDRTINRFNHVYRAMVDSRQTSFNLQPEEVTEVRWFTVDQVKELIKDHPGQVTDGIIDMVNRFYS